MRFLPALSHSPPSRLLRVEVGFRVVRRFRVRSGLWTLETASFVRLGRRVWSDLQETWKLSRSEKLWILGAVARLAPVLECCQAVLAHLRALAAAIRVCLWTLDLRSRSWRECGCCRSIRELSKGRQFLKYRLVFRVRFLGTV